MNYHLTNNCLTCRTTIKTKGYVYSNMTFCCLSCARQYCLQYMEHRCSCCGLTLCDAQIIVNDRQRKFCCIEHKEQYNDLENKLTNIKE